MASSFKFKRFEVSNEASALKVGTDGVLLGAAMTLDPTEHRLLDVGTGTGVIALMVAQRLSDLGADYKIDAVEIDPPSAEEASGNFDVSPWSGNLGAQCCALSDFVPDAPYDHIFSNPPFYDESLRNPDGRKAAARHTDSLSYRELCAFAAENLTRQGRLSVILPAECEKTLLRTAASFSLFPQRLLRVRTTSAKGFRRLITEFSKCKSDAVLEEELTLQNGAERSAEYARLTEDFYL